MFKVCSKECFWMTGCGVLDRSMIAWCLIVEQACELDEAM